MGRARCRSRPPQRHPLLDAGEAASSSGASGTQLLPAADTSVNLSAQVDGGGEAAVGSAVAVPVEGPLARSTAIHTADGTVDAAPCKRKNRNWRKQGKRARGDEESHWVSLWKNEGHSIRVHQTRILLVRLQHDIYARDWASAAMTHAQLLKEFNHLSAALAQSGIEILRAAVDMRMPSLSRSTHGMSTPKEGLNTYLQYMLRLDRRHRKPLTLSRAWEEARQGREKPRDVIDSALLFCTAEGACGEATEI